VQRLLKKWRAQAARQLILGAEVAITIDPSSLAAGLPAVTLA
jgi:hypothetical protein